MGARLLPELYTPQGALSMSYSSFVDPRSVNGACYHQRFSRTRKILHLKIRRSEEAKNDRLRANGLVRGPINRCLNIDVYSVAIRSKKLRQPYFSYNS